MTQSALVCILVAALIHVASGQVVGQFSDYYYFPPPNPPPPSPPPPTPPPPPSPPALENITGFAYDGYLNNCTVRLCLLALR